MQFEKDTTDPFNISEMIAEATGGAAGSSKKYGVQDGESSRASKRARVDADDDEDVPKRARLSDDDDDR